MKDIIKGKGDDKLPESIVDAESGERLLAPNEIKLAAPHQCTNLLQNNQPDEDRLNDFEVNNKIFDEMLLEEEVSDEEDLGRKEFDDQIDAFRKKGKSLYKFITNAGEAFKTNVYDIANHIWKTEDIADEWNLTTIVQIPKKQPRDR